MSADTENNLMHCGFIQRGGEDIYYETVGARSGPVVIFTHGMGGNHMIWYQQVAYFAPICRVVTWDQRGFGRSTNNTGTASPQNAAADIAALLQHLEIDRAHVIGQSLGGWASLGFALKHPERVRSLVLADTSAGIHSERIERQFRDHSARVANSAVSAGTSTTANAIDCHPALGREFGTRDRAKAFLYNQISSLSLAPPIASLTRQLTESFWPSSDVAQMTIPTLFVFGEHDEIFSPDLIRETASRVAGATVREIPSAGHSPYFETPDAWNEIVNEFIRLHT